MGKLLILFVVVPAIELALLIEVGSRLGAIPTIGLIVFTGVLGAYLARRQGVAVLGRVQEQMARGELPAGSLADGAMILCAGALLMTPGILTDAFGFLLLVPAFRDALKDAAMKRFQSAIDQNRVRVHVTGMDPSSERGRVIDLPPDPHDSPLPPKYKVH